MWSCRVTQRDDRVDLTHAGVRSRVGMETEVADDTFHGSCITQEAVRQ